MVVSRGCLRRRSRSWDGGLILRKLLGGPIFLALNLARVSGGSLDTSSIRRLIKRATRNTGVEAGIASDLSGHSMRVGATQDMLVAGFDALAIMQVGGWKTTNVLLRYVENASTRTLQQRRWDALSGRPHSDYQHAPIASGLGKSVSMLPLTQ
jgi:integrase/recombinase XerD